MRNFICDFLQLQIIQFSHNKSLKPVQDWIDFYYRLSKNYCHKVNPVKNKRTCGKNRRYSLSAYIIRNLNYCECVNLKSSLHN